MSRKVNQQEIHCHIINPEMIPIAQKRLTKIIVDLWMEQYLLKHDKAIKQETRS